MTLFTQTRGEGKDIVLLHGWGFHGDVWGALADSLQQHYRVTSIDLPGYGRSQAIASPGLDETTRSVAEIAPPHACWIAWSLGGLIAINQAAKHPDSVSNLVLIASTPKFTQEHDWPDAIRHEVLMTFAQQLENNYEATIKRFLALQTQGCADAKQQIRFLQSQLFSHGAPDVATLRNGLKLLQQTDLRKQLPDINIPALLIGGEQDRLVPPASLKSTQQKLKNASVCLIKGAGHAPFISHPGRVADFITGFLYE